MVSLLGSAAYTGFVSSYFALQSSAVQPLCFVSRQTTGDVSAVIGGLTANTSGGSTRRSSCHQAWLCEEPLPPAIYQRGAEANAMGLADRTGTRVMCLLSQEVPRTLGAYDPFLYLNYAAKWQDPIATYGNESVQQLRELRAKVDPKGGFMHLIPGAFKIRS
ncbi:hypothetical protein DL771_001006 [Monosporascus sp. 5C6A]|nr:hypothetical protein DL771_001006 [Monosporascus sp. 5C6A]